LLGDQLCIVEDAWPVVASLLRRAVTGMVTKSVVVVRTVDSCVGIDAGVLVSLSHGSLSNSDELGSGVADVVSYIRRVDDGE
jgi:hypothetical protein